MKKILLAVVSILAFLGGAFGADLLHQPKGKPGHEAPEGHATETDDGHDAPEAEAHEPDSHGTETASAAEGHGEASETVDWFRFPNQFFVPLLRNGMTRGVMILSLTLEIPAESRPQIEAQEHRLRDALLNALMIQANIGAFDGNFTSEPSLASLRKALLEAARQAGGPGIAKVLIGDIARQDQ